MTQAEVCEDGEERLPLVPACTANEEAREEPEASSSGSSSGAEAQVRVPFTRLTRLGLLVLPGSAKSDCPWVSYAGAAAAGRLQNMSGGGLSGQPGGALLVQRHHEGTLGCWHLQRRVLPLQWWAWWRAAASLRARSAAHPSLPALLCSLPTSTASSAGWMRRATGCARSASSPSAATTRSRPPRRRGRNM